MGDSSTDVQACEAVRAGGGLAISFNGSSYAVKATEVVVVSDCAWSVGMLAAGFRLWGEGGILEVASPERRGGLRALVLPEEMIEPIAMGLQGHTFNLYMSDNPNLAKVTQSAGLSGPGSGVKPSPRWAEEESSNTELRSEGGENGSALSPKTGAKK